MDRPAKTRGWLSYEFFIGLRYLKAKKRGIALTAFISIAGVAVGVAALIATLAVMTGFKEELRDKILGTNAHIVVSHRLEHEFEGASSLLAKITAVPGVVAATPFMLRQVLLSSDAGVWGVVLRGIDPVREAAVTDIAKTLVAGSLEDLKTHSPDQPPGILLGAELASKLDVFVGDTIHLISPVGTHADNMKGKSPVGLTPKVRKFRLVGIFSAGMYEYDTTLAYVALEEAQKFFNREDRVSGLAVRVSDMSVSAKTAEAITEQLGFPFRALDWLAMNRNLFSALQLEKIVMFIILVLIILVASFNIVSTLIMTVLQKRREIAILKTMGATQEGIMRIFMLEGVCIGGAGVLIGLPLGLLICFVLGRYYTLPMDVYYIDHLPVHLLSLDVILVSVSAVLIGFLATLYPSWQAAQIDPAEALRYE